MSVFLDACAGRRSAYTPVWFMRQAGRSLPEYRRARGDTTLLEAVVIPELAAELTLQPVRRYGVDAAILYSDIMTPLYAIDFGVTIRPGIGPIVEHPFRTRDDLDRLRPLEAAQDMSYVLDTIRIVTKELGNIPLIGFTGGPFTLAVYLVEGRPSKSHVLVRGLMYRNPSLWHSLMDRLTDLVITALQAQVHAGCQVVQVFDTWIGLLPPNLYRTHVLPYTKRVFAETKSLGVPRIHFGLNTGALLDSIREIDADVLSIDWRVSISNTRERTGASVIQGNLDPAVLLADWDTIATESTRVCDDAGDSGHIFNLGHGVSPEISPDALTRLVDFLHSR